MTHLFDQFVDEENWKCFVNSVYDEETKTWTCFKRPRRCSWQEQTFK
ncbi:hypothetical protein [Thiocapsa sp.]|nr:hypothetical protein [Thiocapsa sp.]